MASVNFKKCKSAGECKAMMRHSEQMERLKHNHSNPDIDKSMTVQNSSLYGLSYDEMCSKYDDRIRTLDETTNTNLRADRVTMFCLEYTVPEGLPEWQEEAYLRDIERQIIAQYGEQNFIDSARHMDEKHTYIDHGVEKISRAHGHAFVIPEIDGKLNGKKFSSKSQMMKLNQSIDKMSIDKYRIHFMTGKQARHMSVEELKRESHIEEQAIAIQRNDMILRQQYATSQQLQAEQAQMAAQTVAIRSAYDQERQTLAAQYEAEMSRLDAEYAAKRRDIAEREANLTRKEEAISGRELKVEEVEKLQQKTFWTAEDKADIIQTALKSSQNAQKARKAISLEKDARENEEAIRKQNTALQAQNERLQAEQLSEMDKSTLGIQRREIEELKRDIAVRDDFIQKLSLKAQFMEYCRDLGHKLHIMTEDLSHGIRMR